MQVVGDEPNHHRERRSGAAGSQGIEGDAQRPLASPMSDIGYAGSRPPSREPACFRAARSCLPDRPPDRPRPSRRRPLGSSPPRVLSFEALPFSISVTSLLSVVRSCRGPFQRQGASTSAPRSFRSGPRCGATAESWRDPRLAGVEGLASSDNCCRGARAEPGSGPQPRAAGAGAQRPRLEPGEHVRILSWPTMPSVVTARHSRGVNAAAETGCHDGVRRVKPSAPPLRCGRPGDAPAAVADEAGYDGRGGPSR